MAKATTKRKPAKKAAKKTARKGAAKKGARKTAKKAAKKTARKGAAKKATKKAAKKGHPCRSSSLRRAALAFKAVGNGQSAVFRMFVVESASPADHSLNASAVSSTAYCRLPLRRQASKNSFQ